MDSALKELRGAIWVCNRRTYFIWGGEVIQEGFLEVGTLVCRIEGCIGVNWVKRGVGIEYSRLKGRRVQSSGMGRHLSTQGQLLFL